MHCAGTLRWPCAWRSSNFEYGNRGNQFYASPLYELPKELRLLKALDRIVCAANTPYFIKLQFWPVRSFTSAVGDTAAASLRRRVARVHTHTHSHTHTHTHTHAHKHKGTPNKPNDKSIEQNHKAVNSGSTTITRRRKADPEAQPALRPPWQGMEPRRPHFAHETVWCYFPVVFCAQVEIFASIAFNGVQGQNRPSKIKAETVIAGREVKIFL